MEFKHPLAEVITTRMSVEGLSLHALARDTDIPKVTLHRRFADPSGVTYSELARIARRLNVPPSQLLSEAEQRAERTAA